MQFDMEAQSTRNTPKVLPRKTTMGGIAVLFALACIVAVTHNSDSATIPMEPVSDYTQDTIELVAKSSEDQSSLLPDTVLGTNGEKRNTKFLSHGRNTNQGAVNKNKVNRHKLYPKKGKTKLKKVDYWVVSEDRGDLNCDWVADLPSKRCSLDGFDISGNPALASDECRNVC